MLPTTKAARRFTAGTALLCACVISVWAARGSVKPYSPPAPDFRQAGAAAAPVVIVEYSDFQCPACAKGVEPIKQLKAMHGPDRVRVVFKHLAWEFHQYAKPAAVAAECAGKQGKFWEMHDLLFAKQMEWGYGEKAGTHYFPGYAKTLVLDARKFDECVKDPASAAAVDSDIREASERWVHSTPTFFVNGRRFVGAGQLRTRGAREIDKLLKS